MIPYGEATSIGWRNRSLWCRRPRLGKRKVASPAIFMLASNSAKSKTLLDRNRRKCWCNGFSKPATPRKKIWDDKEKAEVAQERLIQWTMVPLGAVLIAFITSTTVNVVGLFIVVAKWMYAPTARQEAAPPVPTPPKKPRNATPRISN